MESDFLRFVVDFIVANGDLMVKAGVEGTTTYTHDALGNLAQVNLPNNDVISYTYDGRNRLISKQVNGVTEYRLIYAGQLSPIAKVDGSGNTLETYIYGIGVNSPDYIRKDGVNYRVIKDHLGSIRMIVNTSTGEVVKTLRYSEFGEVTEETGTFNTIFGFAGGIRDTDSGLTKFGARWYDPETGRWMEKEPLGFAGSDNFYSYCDGDPVNFFDLTGLKLAPVTEKIQELLDKLTKSKLFKEMLDKIKDHEELVTIKEWKGQSNYYIGDNQTCLVNPNSQSFEDHDEIEKKRPPEIGLLHELIHAYHHITGNPNYGDENYIIGFEGENPYSENAIRKQLGFDPRTVRKGR